MSRLERNMERRLLTDSPAPPASGPVPSGGGGGGGARRSAEARAESVRMRFMWKDSGLLPLAAFRRLAKANPLRWSKPEAPAALARRLASLEPRGRPLLVKVDAGEHGGVHSFTTTGAALQWLRDTFQCESGPERVPHTETVREGAMRPGESADPGEVASEEHLCVICLTAPVQIMLVPCRHAVLCEECLGEILQSSRPQCPICRKGILNHATGSFAQDYVDIVEALDARLERACASAYEGMYSRITPFMVTGALLGTGAVGTFVLAPAAAPLWVGLAAGSFCVGYLPWLATTAARFEREDAGGTQLVRSRFLTREDLARPLRLVAKLGLIAVVGPAAVVVFFVPYGIYAGILRPLCRRGARRSVRGAAFQWVYVWRPVAWGVRGAAASVRRAAAALARTTYDSAVAVARATYDYVLVPCGHGLRATGRLAAGVAQELYENILVPSGRSVKDLATGCYRHILYPAGEASKAACRFLVECSASAAHNAYVRVLLPCGRLLAGALRVMGRAIGKAAEMLYEQALLPSARGVRTAGALALRGVRTAGGLALDYVLVPALKRIIIPGTRLICKASAKLLWYILRGTVNGLCLLGAGLAEGARLIYEYALLPCARGAVATAGLTYHYVVVPLGMVVAGTAYTLYHYVMVPTGQAAAAGAQVVHSYVLMPTGAAASLAASTLHEQVLIPGRHAVYTAASTVGSGVQTCAAEVSSASRTVYEASRDACYDLSTHFSRPR